MLLESFLDYSLDDVGDGNKLWSFPPVGEAVGKLWSFLPAGEAVGTVEGHGHDRYSTRDISEVEVRVLQN